MDYMDDYNPYCFVCSRATEHMAEHDDLVDAGMVEYDWDNGIVRKLAAYDENKARAMHRS